jgi:hypothetical protein
MNFSALKPDLFDLGFGLLDREFHNFYGILGRSVMEVNNSSGKTACVPYEIRITYRDRWEIHGICRGICLN